MSSHTKKRLHMTQFRLLWLADNVSTPLSRLLWLADTVPHLLLSHFKESWLRSPYVQLETFGECPTERIWALHKASVTNGVESWMWLKVDRRLWAVWWIHPQNGENSICCSNLVPSCGKPQSWQTFRVVRWGYLYKMYWEHLTFVISLRIRSRFKVNNAFTYK